MASDTSVPALRGDLSQRSPSLFQIARERPLWILLAVVTLFLARPLFWGQTFFFRDLTRLTFPHRLRLVELVRSSGLPLWDPYRHGGQPFLANVHNLPLYPTGVLYFALSPVTALNLEIVLHFLLCALAAYWLSRVLGLGPISSLLAGAAFVLCGFTLSTGNLLNHLLAMPNTVFLLLFWHLFLAQRKSRWFLGAVASGVLIILAGSVELLVLTMAVALGWALVYPYSLNSPPRLGRAFRWSVLGLAILGVAAVQIWSELEVVRQSLRGSGIDYLDLSAWSLNPRRLPELFVARFLGATPSLFEKEYWGDRLEDHPLILSIYFGLPVLSLALTGGLSKGEEGLPKNFRRFLLLVAAVALMLALGRFLLFSPTVYRAFPLGGLFRYPIKALAAACLPLALLTASAAERLGSVRRGLRPVLFLWLAAIALAGVAAALKTGAITGSLERLVFLKPLTNPEQTRLAAYFLQACAASAAMAAVLTVSARTRRTDWLLPALGVILILDLGVAGYGVNPYAPRALLTQEPAIVKLVRQNLNEGRLFRDETPGIAYLRVPNEEVFWSFAWYRETLEDYSGSTFDIPVIFHEDYDFLAQRRLVRLTSSLRRLPWDQRLPLLSSGNVTLILTAERPRVPGLEFVAEVGNRSDVSFYLYRNLLAAPRVGFVTTSVFVHSEDNALRAVLSRGFDPRRHVVIESAGAPFRGAKCAPASIVELERRPTSWRGRVATACDGYLVFSEPFYKGWRGTVDGMPQPINRANLAFSAMAISAGTHVVTKEYRPTAVAIGAGISAVSGMLILGLSFALRSKPSPIPATHESPGDPVRTQAHGSPEKG